MKEITFYINRNAIRVLLPSLFLVLCQPVRAQDNQFSFCVEYSPNLSKRTNEQVPEGYKFSHNVLVRVQYNTEGKTKPSIGLGYFNTGETLEEAVNQVDVESLKYIYIYEYVMATAGGKYTMNRYYALIEASVGVNISNGEKRITKYANGETEKRTFKGQADLFDYRKTIFPVFLSIGRDFSIDRFNFSTGIKCYYVLNDVYGGTRLHHYGFGLQLGIIL